jgi:transposase
MLTQMQELVARAGEALTEPWNKPVWRPRSLGLYHAVEVACMYLRQNGTQEFLGDLRDIFQAAVSRIVTVLVPIIKDVLEEFVPDVEDAIEVVQGRVVLVDGAITPCWSYADHRELWSRKHGTTGFNAQLIGLLDGRAVYISEPLDGRTHDAKAFTETDVATIVQNSGGGIADKGYQGYGRLATPRKKPKHGELGKRDKECNAQTSALRAPVERLVAHFKNWRIFHTDYRRPYDTYRDAYDAGRGLFFFSINYGFE